MEGLRERNPNINRSSKRLEKQRTVALPSYASSHIRTPSRILDEVPPSQSKPKVGLDDEEMLFLARRCLAEEMMSRTNLPDVLSELNSSPAIQRQGSAREIPNSIPIPNNILNQPLPESQPALVDTTPPPQQIVPTPAVTHQTAPRLHAIVPVHRNRIFQLHRLGVGLVILKFGWVWVSCGGLIVADSVLCTSDIFVLIYKRLRQHVGKVGSRITHATAETVKLFRED
jgi:hypothetical protein